MASPMRLQIQINADGTAAITGLQNVTGSVNQLHRAAREAAGGGLTALVNQLKSLAVTATAGIGIAAIARGFISAAVEAQRLEKSLSAVTGSTVLATQEMDYARAMANRMGLAVGDVATAWISLAAATKGTALEGQAARDIFEAVSLAMAKLGKSSADTQGTLLAIEQMISKGKVSAEELRGQLGERLPGAFKLAADAMGVTTARLDEMLAKGELVAEDLLPALAQELRRLYDDGKRVGGLEAEWNRLITALKDMSAGMDQASGATGILANGLRLVTQGVTALTNAMNGLGLPNFATKLDQFNYQVGEMMRLEAEFAAKAKEVAELSKLGPVAARSGLFYNLPKAEAELRALGAALGEVTVKVAQMQSANVEALKAQGEANAKLAASMMDGPVAAFYAQQQATADAKQELLKLAGTYDEAAKRQYQIAEATKKYQEIAKALGKDQAWVNDQVAQFTQGLEANGQAHRTAVKEQKAYEQGLDALIKKFLPARDDAEKLAAATELLKKAQAKGDITATEYAKAMDGVRLAYGAATNAAQELIDQYDPESAKLRQLAADRQALNDIIASGGAQASAAAVALGKLNQAETEALRAADPWAKAWKEAVDSVDDTFQALWRGLLTGQQDVLGNLKERVLEWLADLTYQLLLHPLIVPIQTALMGGTGSAVAGAGSGLSGGGSLFGWLDSSSMGAAYAEMFDKAYLAFASPESLASATAWNEAMSSLSATSNLALGVGSIGGSLLGNALFGDKGYGSMGSSLGSMAGTIIGAMIGGPIGAILGGLLGGTGGGFLGSLFGGKQAPRIGYYAAQVGGNTSLEDWQQGASAYSQGAFGLTFGLNDLGTKYFDAAQLKEAYDLLAQATEELADFFGPELSKLIENQLAAWADPRGLIQLASGQGDLGAALAALVETIADAAGATGEELGLAFDAMLGELSGTVEEVAQQIQQAMQGAQLALELSARYATDLGKMLSLTGNVRTDMTLLSGYIAQFTAAGESNAETLARLVTQLGLLKLAAEQTTTALDGLATTALLELSDALVAAFDSLDAATQAITYYYEQFTSSSQQLADTIAAAADDIAVGLSSALDVSQLEADIQAYEAEIAAFVAALAAGTISQDYYDAHVQYYQATIAELEATLDALTVAEELPATRAEFEALVASIDLTTESGQALYAALMELAPAFDLLYDNAEAFTDWLLGVDEVGQATRELEQVFADFGMTMPATRDDLEALYASGTLTLEQMAILGAYVDELSTVYGDLGASMGSVTDQLGAAYDALQQAVAAEQDAIATTHEARLAALEAEHQAAQEALTAARATLATLQSAISSLRGQLPVDEFSRARAARQLAQWAASGTLPANDDLQRVLQSALALNPQDFASESAYRAAQQGTLASLLSLERLSLKQVSDAERIVACLEDQTAAENAYYEAQLAALDQLIADAQAQLDATEGNTDAVLSLEEAITGFNQALLAVDPNATPIALADLSAELQASVAELGVTYAQQSALIDTSIQSCTQATNDGLTAIRAELIAMRADLGTLASQQLIPLKSVDDRLRRWDVEGLPPTNDTTDVTVLRAA